MPGEERPVADDFTLVFLSTPLDADTPWVMAVAMNLQRLKTKLARLNFSAAARESAAVKAELRRPDQALAESGRGREVLERNLRLLGGTSNGRGRLLTVNGVRVRT